MLKEPQSEFMSRVTEDRLLDCVLNEVLTAIGCTVFAAVPGAWLFYVKGLSGAVGALIAGLLAYAMFTAWDHFGRTRRHLALRARLAELEDRLAAVTSQPIAATHEVVEERQLVQVAASSHGSERYVTTIPMARPSALA